MRILKYEGKTLRKVLIGMIVDDVVCSRIASQWTAEGLFDSEWANLVGGWCVKYCYRFQKAPGKQIRSIYERWADGTSMDDKVIERIESLLVSLSDETDDYEAAYVLDMAAEYFNRVRITEEIGRAQVDLETGSLEDAQNRLRQLRNVELGVGSHVNPCVDYSVWQQAFNTEHGRSLVHYPGDAGNFFRGTFKRGQFYSFMGPDKTGKTTYLLDLSYRLLKERNRVVFFDTGDSTQDEVMVRFCCRASLRPEHDGDLNWPKMWDVDGELISRSVHFEGCDPGSAYRKLQKRTRNKNLFRLSCHANSTLSVRHIESLLIDWEREGWVPDVCIIDYADIMAPEDKSVDGLAQINETWKALRRLSQERHLLVVTATQSNAAAYGNEKGLLSRKNFSGSKAKLAHVNGMIGINVSSDEYNCDRGRLNWVVRRRWRNKHPASCVNVAGCLGIENPIILSRW